MALNPTETATYRNLFERRFEQILELLADMDDDSLDWRPFEADPWGGTSASVGWMVAHSLEATHYLLKRAEWQMGRARWKEVEAVGAKREWSAGDGVASLRERVANSRRIVESFLDSVDENLLDRAMDHPENGRPLSTRMDIVHAIEHLSQHLGHASLTRQLWGIEGSKNA